jgi:hypothetical protein
MMGSESFGVHSGPPLVRGLRIAGLVVMGVVGAAVFGLAFGYFVKLLWNWLMPAIFHLGTITYWQAFGIVILSKLIFGGIGGGGHRGGPHGRRGRRNGPFARGHGEERGGDWSSWREFWNDEGKEAFRRYVERKRGEKGGAEASAGSPGAGGPTTA